MSGRSGLKETGAELDRESVAATIFIPQSKGKRDRDTNVVHSLNLQKILERKVDSAIRREGVAEAEVQARNSEKRNSDVAFFRDESRI